MTAHAVEIARSHFRTPAEPNCGIRCNEQRVEGSWFHVRRLDDLLAYLQAPGLVNDHLVAAFRHREVSRLS
jgi:hypothetical protein